MSDDERGPRGGGYRLEVAKTSQAKCKGPKPCNGNKIEKGSLRFGTMVMIQDRNNFAWRHWGCVTPKLIENMKKKHDVASDIDGFEDISEEFQRKVEKAYENGHVADEDIPDTARKAEGEKVEKKEKKKTTKKRTRDELEEEDTSKKEAKKAGSKKRAKKEGDEQEEVPTKSISKRKMKVTHPDEIEKSKMVRKKKVGENHDADEDMSQNKRTVSRKKASKKSKVSEDESGEDFGDELDKVGNDEVEELSETEIKQTKRAKQTPRPSKRLSSKSSKPTSSRTKKILKSADDDDE